MALLPSEPLDLGDGNTLHADLGKRFPNIVQLERFDDRGYKLHGLFSSSLDSLDQYPLHRFNGAAEAMGFTPAA